jgi:ABC-2 type transport system permease protein
MNALSIAYKDLQILLKDRGALFLLFLLPLLFIMVFSGALGGIGQGEKDARIPLAVVDLDGGQAAQTLLAGLDAAGGVYVEHHEQEQALMLLDNKELDRVLIIPTTFTSEIAGGHLVTLRLVNHPNADPEKTEAVRLVVEGVARDMSLENQIFAALQQMGEMQADAPDASQSFTVEKMQAQARSQFELAEVQPLVSISQKTPQQESTQEESLDLSATAIPGITVLFLFLTAQTAARSIYDEKKVGSFRRLMAAPISKAAILVGKMLPNFITALFQTCLIFAFSIFGLRWMGLASVTLGAEPLATVFVAIVIALCSSAFGILIAAFAHTENQISGLSNLLLWGMAFVGGSFIPLFILERFLGPLPKVVPHYWAIHALTNLMVRGLGWIDVTTDMIVLLGFTALFFVVGLWKFDFD